MLGLHGWGRTRHDLSGLLGSTGHECIAVDLPGFGASAAPPRVWGAADYAASMAELIADIGGGRTYVVVGHSFGGRVATCLAADHAELVAGLVLMGVPLMRVDRAPTPRLRYRLVRAAVRAGLLSQRRLDDARQRHGSEDYRVAKGVMRDVLVRVVNEDYRDELGRIQCPVALVWGAEDRVTPLPVAKSAAERLRRLIVLDAVAGAGHDVHLDVPSRVAGAIAAVVSETL